MLDKKAYNKKYREENKEKIKECRKIRDEKNKERIKIRAKKYREDNIEKLKKYDKEYYQENKEEKKEYNKKRKQTCEYKEKNKKYQRELRKDPIYKLNSTISTSICNSLKTKGLSKNNRHWETLVSYTIKDLKEHLESLFKPGMTWGNRSFWHIDHRIPKSFFEYTSTDDVEFKYMWSLDNLQPLWAKDNMSKGDRLINN